MVRTNFCNNLLVDLSIGVVCQHLIFLPQDTYSFVQILFGL